MKNILIIGAGRSATCLIDYLARQARLQDFSITVADSNPGLASLKIKEHNEVAQAVGLDVTDTTQLNTLINKADIVISMMPAALHATVAENCLSARRHLLTASYLDESLRKMDADIKKANLLFLCEIGLDPGIDHMSALRMVHETQKNGGSIRSFISHCGGLVAPASDDNPWHYKISWNPRNVVLAGKAGARFLLNGKEQELPYEQLFDENRIITVPGMGDYAWYPNRDSLRYRDLYGLTGVDSFIRTTLRHPMFCKGWKKIVELGITDENSLLDGDSISFADFTHWQRSLHPGVERETEDVQMLFEFLGLYDTAIIGGGKRTAANILQMQLETHLALKPDDRDMVLMLHEMEYSIGLQRRKRLSWLKVEGTNHQQTAMAKTVGLPLGIAANLLLNEQLPQRGVHIPVLPEIYELVLRELSKIGILFEESEHILSNA